MALVSRAGDMCSTGHACDGEAPVLSLQTTVKANGINISRETDPVGPHTILVGRDCVGHSAIINVGNPTVKVAGLPIAFVGCSTDAGVMLTGSPNVKVG